jgi:hypothetical protein
VDKSFQGLVLSLIIHALLLWWLVKHPMPSLIERETPTEITLVEKTRRGGSFAPNLNLTPPKEDLSKLLKEQVKMLSDTTRRVKQEMVARQGTVNRNSKLRNDPSPKDMQQMAGKQGQHSGERGELNPEGNNAMKTIMIGGSSINQYIPGIQQGYFTALNQDQFTYYVFFNRVNEQMGQRWVSLLREYAQSLSEGELRKLSSQNRTTVVEIILTKAGEFVRSIIHSTSQYKALDHAAADAFMIASPFLNPPQGMVESDGYIHLRYAMTIYFKPTFGPGPQ